MFLPTFCYLTCHINFIVHIAHKLTSPEGILHSHFEGNDDEIFIVLINCFDENVMAEEKSVNNVSVSASDRKCIHPYLIFQKQNTIPKE